LIQKAESPKDNSPGQRPGFIVKKNSSPARAAESKTQIDILRWRTIRSQRMNMSELPRIAHLDNRKSKLLQSRHERLTVSES
jgi:hypothetical protein